MLAHNKFHVSLMTYTAIAVIFTDFLTGVLTAMLIYCLLFKFFDKPNEELEERPATLGARHSVAAGYSEWKAGSAL